MICDVGLKIKAEDWRDGRQSSTAVTVIIGIKVIMFIFTYSKANDTSFHVYITNRYRFHTPILYQLFALCYLEPVLVPEDVIAYLRDRLRLPKIHCWFSVCSRLNNDSITTYTEPGLVHSRIISIIIIISSSSSSSISGGARSSRSYLRSNTLRHDTLFYRR